uniref:Uncharacterized protein n=1 Tax=Daphnia galeata TaxID=27404 RepID=A0A8J2RVM4_9CRUS|nr:unnamed protein product [Daphnia galeata]
MDPPIWPFTMDYGVTHDCVIAPYTNETHPGLWDIPMVVFQNGENGKVCSNLTPCILTASEIFDYFMFNFERYNNTRTPFDIYQHIYWLAKRQVDKESYYITTNKWLTTIFLIVIESQCRAQNRKFLITLNLFQVENEVWDLITRSLPSRISLAGRLIGDEIQLKQLTLPLFAQSTYFGIDFDLILNP